LERVSSHLSDDVTEKSLILLSNITLTTRSIHPSPSHH
jgi:hypothetical protein